MMRAVSSRSRWSTSTSGERGGNSRGHSSKMRTLGGCGQGAESFTNLPQCLPGAEKYLGLTIPEHIGDLLGGSHAIYGNHRTPPLPPPRRGQRPTRGDFPSRWPPCGTPGGEEPRRRRGPPETPHSSERSLRKGEPGNPICADTSWHEDPPEEPMPRDLPLKGHHSSS